MELKNSSDDDYQEEEMPSTVKLKEKKRTYNDEDSDYEVSNPGWADAMAKVLHTKTDKSFILKKAKKDCDFVETKKKDIEIVNEEGKVIKDPIDEQIKQNDYQNQRKKLLEQKEKKLLWRNMCRVKPDISEKVKERTLARIATKGVVQLFNAVRQHQKTLGEKLSLAGNSEVKKEKILKTFTKGEFLDILKNKEKKSQETEKDEKSSEEKQNTWDALRDNFMMEATLKDWDKD